MIAAHDGVAHADALRFDAMKRAYGSSQLYQKSGAHYGRWRTPDGRRLNRRLDPIRSRRQRGHASLQREFANIERALHR